MGREPYKIGYIRVSSKGQADNTSFENQKKEMKDAGAQFYIQDVFTGTTKDRPGLTKLLNELVPGDEVIVTKMDRLARSAKEGLEIIDMILGKGATIRILNMGTFDNSPMGKMTRTIALAFAEFERDMIVQRMQEGKRIAKQSGDYHEGRPRKYSTVQLDHAMQLLCSKSYSQVERMTGISVSTIKRYKRKSGSTV